MNTPVIESARIRTSQAKGVVNENRRTLNKLELGVSIVIPIHNERENVVPLLNLLHEHLPLINRPYEVLLIDDGSNDGTDAVLREHVDLLEEYEVITLRRNTGQTAALMAGFDHARFPVIVTLDGDLQNDPKDIPSLLSKLDEGFDVVSGWRRVRHDDVLRRTLPSQMANWLISKISGVRLHDYGCTLKAYRREVLDGVRLYGEMHRFIPIYARWKGARVCEVLVTHHPRRFGRSKYGFNRIYKVLLDLLVVKFLMDFQTRPIHVFGAAGFMCFGVALLSGLFAVYLRFGEGISFIQTPMPLLVVMSFITGMMCILLGLLAELLVRIYYEGRGGPAYDIRARSSADE